jgi:mannonate dehydratase
MARPGFSSEIGRRDFGRLTVGTLGAAALAGQRVETLQKVTPGIKLCVQGPAKPSDEQLLFYKQIGAQYASVASTPDLRTADGFMQIKQRYADAGVTVWNIGNTSVHNMPEVTLNLPGRAEKIEEYKQYLRNLGKAGIGYSTYAHMGNGIWTSGRRDVRGASAREFDQNSPDARGNWDGKVFTGPLSHGREYTKDEIWENYTYFIKQVAPVAKRLACTSASILTIRRCRCSQACRAASSATSKATSARWRLPTARMSASVYAAARGWRAARSSPARIPRR